MSDLYMPLEQEIKTWDGIHAVPHRFGGVEFQWNHTEVGHIHRGGMMDIPFTRRIRDALLDAQLVEPHHLLPETGWITFYIRTAQDLDTARTLMRLSYLHKRRRRLPEADYAAELALLVLPETVQKSAQGLSEPAETT
jgi:hypothetical protein